MLLESHDCVTSAPVRDGTLPDRPWLRRQIAQLEAELAQYAPVPSVAGFAPVARPVPRVLGEAGLRAVRDDLTERLLRARADASVVREEQDRHRRRLEDMLALPKAYKWHRVANADLGEPGCGVWQVRPRLGLIGMLAGWWHVKVSSGCPLAGAAPGSGAPALRSRCGKTQPQAQHGRR